MKNGVRYLVALTPSNMGQHGLFYGPVISSLIS